jgi:hypothetical protein
VDLGAPGRSHPVDDALVTRISNSVGKRWPAYVAAQRRTCCRAVRCRTADLKANLLGSVDPSAALAGITVTGGRLNVKHRDPFLPPGGTIGIRKSRPGKMARRRDTAGLPP